VTWNMAEWDLWLEDMFPCKYFRQHSPLYDCTRKDESYNIILSKYWFDIVHRRNNPWTMIEIKWLLKDCIKLFDVQIPHNPLACMEYAWANHNVKVCKPRHIFISVATYVWNAIGGRVKTYDGKLKQHLWLLCYCIILWYIIVDAWELWIYKCVKKMT